MSWFYATDPRVWLGICFVFLVITTLNALLFVLRRATSTSSVSSYRCDCCLERHLGSVAEMHSLGWSVLPGGVHYCPLCSERYSLFLPPVNVINKQKLNEFGCEPTNPYRP